MARERRPRELDHEKVQSERELALELKRVIEHAAPWHTIPGEDMTDEAVRAQAFESWAQAWLAPLAKQLAYRAGILDDFEIRESFAKARTEGRRWPEWWPHTTADGREVDR